MMLTPVRKNLVFGTPVDILGLQLNFANSGAAFDPRITYSGASARMYFDSTGVLKYAPMNLIRNNTMVGAVAGTPGTLPTNWVAALQGLTQTIVGAGTESGVSYIDINLAGTTTSTNPTIIFESITQVAALTGQVWTAATYVAIVGGTLTGVTDTRQVISERTAAGAVVTNQLGTARTIDSALTRYTDTVTLSGGATTAYIYSAVRLTIATSTAVNITLRIGMPQLQRGSEATPAIPTTTAAVYLPRSNAYQDHDPSTLAPLGFLIEEARTNSVPNNTMQGAVVGTPGTAPTGWTGGFTSTGGLTREILSITPEKGLARIRMRLYGTATGTSASLIFSGTTDIVASTAQTWTESVFVAYENNGGASQPTVSLQIAERTAAGALVANGSQVISPTATISRFEFTRLLVGGATVARVTAQCFVTLVVSSTYDFIIDIAVPQLELGAFATSPILTSGAAATRLVDSASMTGTNFSSWYNQTEGTFVVQGNPNANLATSRMLFDVSDGTTTNRMSILRQTGNKVQLFVGTSAGTQANITTSNDAGVECTIGASYKVDDFAVCVDGGAVATDTSGTLPTVSVLRLGARADAANQLNGHLQSITYYRKRLSNETLQTLTS